MNLGDGLGNHGNLCATTDAMPAANAGPRILKEPISWSPRFILCSQSRCGHIHRHKPGDENGDVECAGDCLHDRESPRESGHRSHVAKADRAQSYKAEVEGIEAIHPAGRMGVGGKRKAIG
jgi:hypothetical protein